MTPIEIYGRPNCIYCDQAKALAITNGYDFTYRDITDIVIRKEMNERCKLPPSTVPQIFVGARHIGGFVQLSNAQADGTLQQMIAGF